MLRGTFRGCRAFSCGSLLKLCCMPSAVQSLANLLLFCLREALSLYSSGCPGAQYEDEADPQFPENLLPLPLKCWEQMCVPPCLASMSAPDSVMKDMGACVCSCPASLIIRMMATGTAPAPGESLDPDTGLCEQQGYSSRAWRVGVREGSRLCAASGLAAH